MTPNEVATWLAISGTMLGGGLWLGALSNEVKNLREQMSKEPTLSQIYTEMKVMGETIKHLGELLETHNIKPRSRS